MIPRAWALLGLGALLLGGGLLWFGYSEEVVAERHRREFIQGALSDAATAAGHPDRFRQALREVLRELDGEGTGLSAETRVDGRFTATSLFEDAGTIDSTAARVELLRFVARVDAAEPDPERWVGRAGLVALAAGLYMVGTAISRHRRAGIGREVMRD